MENNLGIGHFLNHTDVVGVVLFIALLVMSIGCWYLIISKGIRTWLAAQRSAQFLQRFWDAKNLEEVAQQIRETGTVEPFSHLVHHGFTALEQHARSEGQHTLIDAGAPEEFLTRALKRAIDEDKSRMETGLTFLATTASSAPFIGLFGTVWGIYHALIAIGASGQASLDKVAGPVGEALIMTGLGLAVAIPAAIAYNTFARSNRNTLAKLNSFAHDVFTFLGTGLKSGPLLADAKASEQMIARFHSQQKGA